MLENRIQNIIQYLTKTTTSAMGFISLDPKLQYFETNENESKLKIVVKRSKINQDSNSFIKFDAKLVDEKGKASQSYSFEVTIDILIGETKD